MKSRRRRSLLPRADWRRTVGRNPPLKGSVWTRSERVLREPDVHIAWRIVAALMAVATGVLLGWLLYGPAFAIRSINVTGAQHLGAAAAVRAAGLRTGSSVLLVDPQSGRAHLLAETWVRTAEVSPGLFGSVSLDLAEWDPVATWHAGTSTHSFLLSNQGGVLGPLAGSAAVVDIQGPSGKDPRAGEHVIDAPLLTALVNIRAGLPRLIGQEVGNFILDSCGDLTMVAKRGWKVYFGRVLTPEEFASLHDKVAALKAIASSVDYNNPDLEYVNVMNPGTPAVKMHAPPPSPSPPSSPSPAPSPSAVPLCR